jgi:hypothetical protein
MRALLLKLLWAREVLLFNTTCLWASGTQLPARGHGHGSTKQIKTLSAL